MIDEGARNEIKHLKREAYANAKNALERDNALEERVSELELQVGALRRELEQRELHQENSARAAAGLETTEP